MVARVKEILLDKYILDLVDTKEQIDATIRGNVKKKSNILVGDLVNIENIDGKYVIEDILPRRNFLIRPPVANIDKLVIVQSLTMPSPDFLLLDKQLVLCSSRGIEPIIVVNKIDLNISNVENDIIKYIKNTYESIYTKVIYTSTKTGVGIDNLKNCLNNCIAAFSGNSGVGKSSIINSLVGNKNENNVGDIAKKTNRGKHTTKYVRLYELQDNTYILDTPGFSSYELYDIEYKELKNYYEDFGNYRCKYDDCNHINEDVNVCAVKAALNDGILDKGRYTRYVELYNKLKDIYDRKYK